MHISTSKKGIHTIIALVLLNTAKYYKPTNTTGHSDEGYPLSIWTINDNYYTSYNSQHKNMRSVAFCGYSWDNSLTLLPPQFGVNLPRASGSCSWKLGHADQDLVESNSPKSGALRRVVVRCGCSGSFKSQKGFPGKHLKWKTPS